MDATRASLLDMGFDANKIEKALRATTGKNLEEAMDWLVAHEDDPELDVPLPSAEKVSSPASPMEESSVEIVFDSNPAHNVDSASASVAPKPSADGVKTSTDDQIQEAHSYKCEDCGKLFRNEDEVQFHAAKSQHTNFSESTEIIKALSEEEKKERLKQLQARLKAKREQTEAEEKKKAIDMEKNRRKMGQEMLAAKQRIQEEEMKKIAEDRKRQKREDQIAKQKILEQIKIDRQSQKKENDLPPSSTPSSSVPAAESKSEPPKNYDETIIQIRLFNGSVMKHTFKVKEQLSAVRLYVELYRTDGDTPFSLMTNFPKKVFTDEDMEKPLQELGLVPSAVLIMMRKI